MRSNNKKVKIFAPFVLFFVRWNKETNCLCISADVTDGLTPLQLNKKHRK